MTEQNGLREQIEYGRRAKIAIEFLRDVLLQERAMTINQLETVDFLTPQDLVAPVMYLRALREIEMKAQTCINMGEIAEKELSESGEPS